MIKPFLDTAVALLFRTICWRRGSGTWAKHWRIETGFVLAMILLLREPCRTEKNHSWVHLSKSRPAPKIHRQESGAIALPPDTTISTVGNKLTEDSVPSVLFLVII